MNECIDRDAETCDLKLVLEYVKLACELSLN